jgi:Sec-independent protein secretion pathway component TatC
MVEPLRHSKELTMSAELVALLIVGSLIEVNLLVSTIAMALGVFAAASPRRAAEIWGSQRLQNLAPEHKTSFVRWYRVFGVFLFLGGLLFAVESIVFSKYHR